MLKMVSMVFAAAVGAAGASAWLLSEPLPNVTGAVPASVHDRLEELKLRFNAARAQGAAAQAETENRLHHELAAFRQHPDRPGVSFSG